MASKEEVATLIKDFVGEYLENSPEYIDVVEFVSENIEDEDDINDDLLKEIYTGVVAEVNALFVSYTEKED